MRISHPLVPAFAAIDIVISPLGATGAALAAATPPENRTHVLLARSPNPGRHLA